MITQSLFTKSATQQRPSLQLLVKVFDPVWQGWMYLDRKEKRSESCIQAFTSCSPFLRSFLNDSNSEKCPDSLFSLERNSLLCFRDLAPG